MQITYEANSNSVRLDVHGETRAERALLSHFQEGHVALLCQGQFKDDGVRVFIREKSMGEHKAEIADEFGRKKMLERRRAKRRNRK